jgi:hypothetical protein
VCVLAVHDDLADFARELLDALRAPRAAERPAPATRPALAATPDPARR